MPLQNRVTPLGELVATSSRGLVYGNRGCLHDADGRIRRVFAGKRWIACRLQFRGWHRRPLLQPGRFTELFFLDDATALAAGHRPCALCRRADYVRFVERWHELHPSDSGADAIDARLHAERVDESRARRLREGPTTELPDGTCVLIDGAPWFVRDAEFLAWSPAGYAARMRRTAHPRAHLVTPPSLVELLRAGWDPLVPFLHPSAESLDSRTPPATT